MEYSMVVGIDPGASGGICLMTAGGIKKAVKMQDDIYEVAAYLKEEVCGMGAVVYLEQVNAMPKQGLSSTFKFGENYGCLQGVLAVLDIPLRKVRPHIWQGKMGCRSKGDKKVTKLKASQLFPMVKPMTHAIADACLIAKYGWEMERGVR